MMDTPIATVFAGNLPPAPMTMREKKRERFRASYIRNYKMLVSFHKQAMEFCKFLKVDDAACTAIDESFNKMRVSALRKYKTDMTEYNSSINKIKKQVQ